MKLRAATIEALPVSSAIRLLFHSCSPSVRHCNKAEEADQLINNLNYDKLTEIEAMMKNMSK